MRTGASGGNLLVCTPTKIWQQLNHVSTDKFFLALATGSKHDEFGICPLSELERVTWYLLSNTGFDNRAPKSKYSLFQRRIYRSRTADRCGRGEPPSDLLGHPGHQLVHDLRWERECWGFHCRGIHSFRGWWCRAPWPLPCRFACGGYINCFNWRIAHT